MSGGPSRFETKDIHFRNLAALMGGLVILFAMTILITRAIDRLLIRALSSRGQVESPPASHSEPPEPRLQVNPAVDLLRLRDVENVTLNHYAWIDPAGRAVRIPITRAMAIVVERGLPARPASQETSHD